MATTDHVYIFDGPDNTRLISKERVGGCSAISPGRGGDWDKIKCFPTGVTVVKRLDHSAAILDNF